MPEIRLRRVLGIALRQWLTLRHSMPRLFEVFYWPILEVVLWGLVTQYLLTQSGAVFAPSLLIGGMILWTMLHRAQEDLAIAFLEESWSQNLPNIFASPLHPLEYFLASALVGTIKVTLAATAVSVLAYLFYGFGLWQIGPTLIGAMPALVMFGWSMGLVTVGLILRFGRQVDVLAWSFAILFQPLVCAVYPLNVLHPSLQIVAGLLPPTHVFEAIRAASAGAPNPTELIVGMVGSAVALTLALVFYVVSLRYARTMGRLASAGE
ncbi:MAG: ABC transporter permease [Chloroflexi bacterium]|nr:ABC transporter permease [Chloroflexota bacterium]